METGKKGPEEWIEHMKKLYHEDTKGWKKEQWSEWGKKCVEIQRQINPNKSGKPAWYNCDAGKTLSDAHFELLKLQKTVEAEENRKKMIDMASEFFGLKWGGSKKSRKSKASQKSRQSRKQSKRLEREIQLSKIK